MKSSAAYVFAAVILAAVAGLVAAGATLERQMAAAQTRMAVADLVGAERRFREIEDRLDTGGWLAAVLAGPQDEVAAHQVAIRYWRGDYARLLSEYARNADARVRRNVPLRITVANSAYRAGQRPDATVGEMLNGLDQAIDLYTELLQDVGERHDLAFNYEFLVTLRDALGNGADWAPRSSENPLGQEGGQPPTDDTDLDDVEIFVPMYHDERDLTDEPTRGTDPPIERKG